MNPQRTLRLATILIAVVGGGAPVARAARLKDLVEVEGFRPNFISGIGLVVGLAGTGDDPSPLLLRGPVADMLKKLGYIIDPADVKARNVALTIVASSLPPFARPGMAIDVTVSSMGTAKSLEGGVLVGAMLQGPDREVYAIAQGPLAIGGFSAGGASGSSTTKNHTTVGRIPGGGRVEREAPGQLPKGDVVLVLREPDFTTAMRIAEAICRAQGEGAARVRDPSTVLVPITPPWQDKVVDLVSQLEAITASPDQRARVVISERTGTIVVGANVTLGAAAIAHGGITVTVQERPVVSQPGALSSGKTEVVPETEVLVHEKEGSLHSIPEATTVSDVASALNALGVKPRDLAAIFQALKASGSLRAEIELL